MSTEVKNWTADQERFIAWLALPKAERRPRSHLLLAQELDLTVETLSRWKHLPGLMDQVNALARELVKHDVAEVLGVIRTKAKKGDLPYVNMVLAMGGLSQDIRDAGFGPSNAVVLAPPIREVLITRPDTPEVSPEEQWKYTIDDTTIFRPDTANGPVGD